MGFVSIPDGLPRPFSQAYLAFFIYWRPGVSIPDGLPRPFSPMTLMDNVREKHGVSIPDGLPRPFSQLTERILSMVLLCFNPERAPQAI